MKNAKKVLAVMMALGLMMCMAAVAFAQGGTYSLDVIRSEDEKTVVATLTAHDYIGLSSGKVVVNYEGLTLDHVSTGIQAKAVNNAENNSFTFELNKKETGRIVYGFVFQESLWTADQFAAAGTEEEPLVINTENFDLVSFYFKVKDKVPYYKVAIDVVSKNEDVDNPEFKDEYIVPLETETTTACPNPGPCNPCQPTNPCNPCRPNPCNPCQPGTTCEAWTNCCCQVKPCQHTPKMDDGGKDTGDNSILAVMAGVMVLAGAAVVVTKKRK